MIDWKEIAKEFGFNYIRGGSIAICSEKEIFPAIQRMAEEIAKLRSERDELRQSALESNDEDELSFYRERELRAERDAAQKQVLVLREALELLISNTRLALIDDSEAEANVMKAQQALASTPAPDLGFVTKLVDALKFYASTTRWEWTTHESTYDGIGCTDFETFKSIAMGPSQVGGKTAREALAATKADRERWGLG